MSLRLCPRNRWLVVTVENYIQRHDPISFYNYIFPISKKISAFAKFCVEKWVEVSFLFPYREDFGDEVMDQRF